MRINKIALYIAIVSAMACALAGSVFGTIAFDPAPGVITYNRFLVADLGLTRGGGRYSIFNIRFSGLTGTTSYSLQITVTRSSDGKQLLTGLTDPVLGSVINGNTYANYQLDDAFGGGDFIVSEDEKQLQRQVLATGALPRGTYTISLELISDVGGPITFQVVILPPFLQPVSPVDVSVTRDALNFRWVSNIADREFHLFTDPRGNREVTSGGRLPVLGLGTASSLDGSLVAPLLTDATTYYWQVWGKITTSHGEERVKSALSRFLYFEESVSVIELGLTDAEKISIKSELLAILEELVNRRAARSIKDYELDRAVLDNGVVTYEEIMAILSIIKEKRATVNAIYFK
jgi:hypothetical protein